MHEFTFPIAQKHIRRMLNVFYQYGYDNWSCATVVKDNRGKLVLLLRKPTETERLKQQTKGNT